MVCMSVWYDACHTCVYVWKSMHAYVYTGRRQGLMMAILLYYSLSLIFETGSLTELGAHHSARLAGWQVPKSYPSSCILLDLGWRMRATMPCFCMGAGDPHWGLHVFTISTLSIEKPSRFLLFFIGRNACPQCEPIERNYYHPTFKDE